MTEEITKLKGKWDALQNPYDFEGRFYFSVCMSEEFAPYFLANLQQMVARWRWQGTEEEVQFCVDEMMRVLDRFIATEGCEMGEFVTSVAVDCESKELVVDYSGGGEERLDLSCIVGKLVSDVQFDLPNEQLEIQFNDGTAHSEDLSGLVANLLEGAEADCAGRVLKFTRHDGSTFGVLLDCLLPSLVELVFINKNDKTVTVQYTDEGPVVFDLNSWFNELIQMAWIDCDVLEFGTRTVDGFERIYDLTPCLEQGAGTPPKVVYPPDLSPVPNGTCDTSYNAYLALMDMRNAIGVGLGNGDNANQLAIIMREESNNVIPPTNPAYFLWFTTLIQGQTLAWWEALVTQQDINDFGCAYYCAQLKAPDSTKQQYLSLVDYLTVKYPSPENLTYSFFLSILQVWGVSGLYNALAHYESTGNDCSACVCECILQLSDDTDLFTDSSNVGWVSTNSWVLQTGETLTVNDTTISSCVRMDGEDFSVVQFTGSNGNIVNYGYILSGETTIIWTTDPNDILGECLDTLIVVGDERGCDLWFDIDCDCEPPVQPILYGIDWWGTPVPDCVDLGGGAWNVTLNVWHTCNCAWQGTFRATSGYEFRLLPVTTVTTSQNGTRPLRRTKDGVEYNEHMYVSTWTAWCDVASIINESTNPRPMQFYVEFRTNP